MAAEVAYSTPVPRQTDTGLIGLVGLNPVDDNGNYIKIKANAIKYVHALDMYRVCRRGRVSGINK